MRILTTRTHAPTRNVVIKLYGRLSKERNVMLARMRKAFVKRASPNTILGRWCGPWYNETCDVMRKGRLADMDNSVWNAPPLPSEAEEDLRKDPINVFLCS